MQHRLARKSSSLGWLFGARERREEPIRGLYIFGEVGRGKTMLMDLFFAASRVVRKRRVHFHEFMGDVHERIAVIRRQQKNGAAADEDPIRLDRRRHRGRELAARASTSSTSPTSPTP